MQDSKILKCVLRNSRSVFRRRRHTVGAAVFRFQKFQLVADARARAEYRMRGQFQHTMRPQGHPRNPEWFDVFFDVYDVLFPIEKNQIDREKHADCMHPVRGNNPKTLPGARPLAGLSQQTNEPPKIGIGDRHVRGDKALTRPVQYTHSFPVIRHMTLSI
jgi:hypothetical protein